MEKVIIDRKKLERLEALDRLFESGKTDIVVRHNDYGFCYKLSRIEYRHKSIPEELEELQNSYNKILSENIILRREKHRRKSWFQRIMCL